MKNLTFVVVFLSALLSFTSLLIYWLVFDAAAPFEAKTVDVRDIRGHPRVGFQPGEIMVVQRENCASKAVMLFMSRSFRNIATGVDYVREDNDFMMPAGCQKTAREMIIPNVPPGRYLYVVNARYANNPLVVGVVQLPAPEITVIQ